MSDGVIGKMSSKAGKFSAPYVWSDIGKSRHDSDIAEATLLTRLLGRRQTYLGHRGVKRLTRCGGRAPQGEGGNPAALPGASMKRGDVTLSPPGGSMGRLVAAAIKRGRGASRPAGRQRWAP